MSWLRILILACLASLVSVHAYAQTEPVEDLLASLDQDGDLIPDLIDDDRDGDGVANGSDAFPDDPDEWSDIDGDGTGDNADPDRDGDGIANEDDAFPNDPSEWSDFDGDGIGDNSDPDRDGDGVDNGTDVFPDDPNEWSDIDNDGIGDNSDGDRDGDGVVNESDAFPNDPSRTKLPVVTIDSPADLSTVGASPISVSGTVDADAVSLTLNGIAISFSGTTYSGTVALEEGSNTVIARMVDSADIVSTASIHVILDMTPPYITVESHVDGQTVHSNSIAISGLVNDIVRGTVSEGGATVTVNGVAASVSNRSYLAENVSLNQGANTITIVASDDVGNTETKTVTLYYQPPSGPQINISSGQDQTGPINSVLVQPLVVTVVDGNGNPVAGKEVIFRVTRGSGLVGIGVQPGNGFVATTNGSGVASTQFQLGNRAGVGNHKVTAKVVGYDNAATFYASATRLAGDKVSVYTGNNQRGATYQPLPGPFVVTVTDEGANMVSGATVRFRVLSGGGLFPGDATSVDVTTDSDGRAAAHLTLGGITGVDQQRVEVELLDSVDGDPRYAGFTATAFVPGAPGETSISGVVMDNQDNPLAGVTLRVAGTTRQDVSDAQGQFTIANVPVGPVHLVADGTTISGDDEYPTLGLNLVTVPGVDNPLPSPIYMVKLGLAGAAYAGPQDVVVTAPDLPGFSLEIAANSVTFPDSSNEGYVSATPVNVAKVPMPPPDGMQPQFVLTIQPTGALFDPPAPITMPNLQGHPPGTQIELQSFDHDLEQFVTIGLGTVSSDGNYIRSNPGVGIIKAGWNWTGQPNSTGPVGNKKPCTGAGCEQKPEDDGDPGCEGAGDPINIANGNMYFEENDFTGHGPFPLRVTRAYNSSRGTWRHSYGHQLLLESSSPDTYRIYGPDGEGYAFTQVGGVWQSTSAPFDSLMEVTGQPHQWDYRRRNGERWLFDAQGRLLKRITVRGEIHSLVWSANTATVEDDSGNQMTLTFNSLGQLDAAQVDTLVWDYEYDAQDRLIKVHYPDASFKQYHYEDSRHPTRMTGVTDQEGIRYATWQYDRFGRAILNELAGEKERYFLAYQTDNVTTVTNPLGKKTVYHFENINGQLRIGQVEGQQSANCLAANQDTTYTSSGLVETRTDWKGNVTRFEYNSRGLVTKRTEAYGTSDARDTLYDWDATRALMTQITQPGGRIVEHGYDAQGRRTSTTVSDGTPANSETTTYTYDSSNRLTEIDGPRTDVTDETVFGYDAEGRGYLTTITDGLNHVTQLEQFNVYGQPQKIIDPNSAVTLLQYDDLGRLTQLTVKDPSDASGNSDAITQYGYNAIGLLTGVTLPNGHTLSYEYDHRRQLTRVTNTQGEKLEYSRDAQGNVTEERHIGENGSLAYQQQRVFDELSRLFAVIDAGSQRQELRYDQNGNLTTLTNARGYATTFAYDALDRLTTRTDAAANDASFGYDARDNLQTVTDEGGATTTYTYDTFNRVTQLASPDTGTTTYTYDKAGNLKTRTDNRGVVTNYAYDALNRLTARTYPANSSLNASYTYDSTTGGNAGIGRLTRVQDASGTTEYSYDHRGNRIQRRFSTTVAGQARAHVTDYEYDLADNLTEIRYPSGISIQYQRDSAGRISAITASYTDGENTTDYTIATSLSYLPNGAVTGLSWGNGLTLTRTYDPNYRLTDQQIGSVQQRSYSHDANGNITAITDQLNSLQSGSYQYDALDRITGDSGAYGDLTYQYDPVGNRTSKAITAGSSPNPTPETANYGYGTTNNRLTTITTEVGTANEATTNLSYSGSGNITAMPTLSYTYDEQDRISAVSKNGSQVASYTYNAFGERTKKIRTASGNTVVFTYQGPQLLDEIEYDSSGSIVQRRAYIWLDQMPVAYLQKTGSNAPELIYLHADHLNTPKLATNQTGDPVWRWRSDAFGVGLADNLTATSYGIGLRFPGQYYDEETGQHYNYFRDYDPTLGRYIQSDPIGLQGGLNTYLYVNANPMIFIDPYGLLGRTGGGHAGAGKGTGRVGVFGCLIGCASYTEGDSQTQASISPTLGGGFMVCSSPPKNEPQDCPVEEPKKDCGIYDPNCDDSVEPSASMARSGMGIGVARNSDGSVCVMVGPFVSYPIISPNFNLGGLFE